MAEHRSFRHAAGWLLALTLSLPGAAPAVAQEEGDRGPTFFETIEVNIVNVDVVVTDRDGNPVAGLTEEDFELYEDGRPVEITNFFAVDGGGAAPVPEPLPETAADEEPMPLAPIFPEEQRLHLVVFVDNLNITPPNRNQILKAMEKFAHGLLKPQDRVMVVAFNGEIDVRQSLTGDPEALLAALDETAKGTARGVEAGLDFRDALRMIGDVQGGSSGGTGGGGIEVLSQDTTEMEIRAAFAAVRRFSEARYLEARQTVGALKEFVNSLAAIRGRKAILYVSDGLSVRPGEALMQAFEDKFRNFDAGPATRTGAGEILRYDVVTLIDDLVQEANANRVTFYAIGAGNRVYGITPVEENLDATGNRVWTPALESLEATNLFASLKTMSDATGGFAGSATRNLEALLRRMRQDFDTYYSLAYTPPHRRDGKNHSIKVKVTDPELRVRYREGYRDKTTEERMEDRTRSALLLGISDNPLEVRIDFGREEQNDEGQWRVPVVVKIPMGNLVLLPQEHFHEGRISIFLGARDGKGRSSPIQTIPVPIRIPNEQLLTVLGQVGAYNLTMLMRSGPHTVAVTVRDELANVDSAVATDYTPGRLRVKTGS